MTYLLRILPFSDATIKCHAHSPAVKLCLLPALEFCLPACVRVLPVCLRQSCAALLRPRLRSVALRSNVPLPRCHPSASPTPPSPMPPRCSPDARAQAEPGLAGRVQGRPGPSLAARQGSGQGRVGYFFKKFLK